MPILARVRERIRHLPSDQTTQEIRSYQMATTRKPIQRPFPRFDPAYQREASGQFASSLSMINSFSQLWSDEGADGV
jgi:hypothetical protein